MNNLLVRLSAFFIAVMMICGRSSADESKLAASVSRPAVSSNEIEFEPKCLSEKAQLDPTTQPSGKVVPPRNAIKPPLPPEVPLEITKARDHGTVVVGVFVTEKGRVAKARVLHSTATARLDELSLKGARDWRFVAGRIDGTKACMWIPVTLTYFDPKDPPRIPTL